MGLEIVSLVREKEGKIFQADTQEVPRRIRHPKKKAYIAQFWWRFSLIKEAKITISNNLW
jgi:hypothetical protein